MDLLTGCHALCLLKSNLTEEGSIDLNGLRESMRHWNTWRLATQKATVTARRENKTPAQGALDVAGRAPKGAMLAGWSWSSYRGFQCWGRLGGQPAGQSHSCLSLGNSLPPK